jgi:hypothetical protein
VGVKDVGVIFAADNLRNEIGHGHSMLSLTIQATG